MKTIELSELASKVFRADNNEVVNSGGSRVNKTIMNLFKNNKSRKLICVLNIEATRKLNFLTPNTKKIFNHLQLAFIKTPIF